MVKKRRQSYASVKVMMLMAVAAIGLSGCGDSKSAGMDPIEWYRDLSGDSKNDVQDKAANSKNLNEGSKEPYPNLSSVPKQPDNAITKADREKMAQSLLADRQNAQYTDQQLRAGQNMQAVAPPPPEAPAPKVAAVSPVPAQATTAGTPTPARTAPAKVAAAPVAPVKQEALAAPQQTAAANPPPSPSPAAPAPRVQQTARVPAPSAPPPEAKPKKDEARKKEEAKKKPVKRGSEQPAEESSLRPPSIGVMPTGEEARNAPPPPRSEEVAEAGPTHSDVDAAKGSHVSRNIEIKFTPGPYKARILPADHNRLVEVAKLAEHNNARIRIVGYGGAPAQGDLAQREFQSFNAALDNAKAVGIELAKLGVPANRIDIETKSNANSPDRAEVFVEY